MCSNTTKQLFHHLIVDSRLLLLPTMMLETKATFQKFSSVSKSESKQKGDVLDTKAVLMLKTQSSYLVDS